MTNASAPLTASCTPELGKPDYGKWMDPFTYEGGTRRDRVREQRRLAADLAHRADIQHTLVLAGDPRGIFGDYPPEIV